MASTPRTNNQLSAQDPVATPPRSAPHRAKTGQAGDPDSSRPFLKLRISLTTTMSLLSLLVFGLAVEKRNTLWLWIGFIYALISGVFFQLLINRRRAEEEAESRKDRG